MLSLIRAIILTCTFLSGTVARSFVDDRGVEFTWPDGGSPPTVVVNANGGLSLFHLGMTKNQILGVWDKWIIRGSDIDINSDDPVSIFEADPNREELDFLFSVKNLSPSCFSSENGCVREFDVDLLEELNPDFTIYIHHGPFPEITDQIIQVTGKQPIYIDATYENSDGCRVDTDFNAVENNCYARSVIDVIQRTQDLADFLGVPRTEQVRQEQQKMCEAANEFSLMARKLHDRGVRCAAATARTSNGGTINLVNLNKLPWLRTFEELGLPLIHAPLDSSTEFAKSYGIDTWFPKCNSQGSNQCEDLTPVLPVDCWLLDSRSFALAETNLEDLITFIPVEALAQQQYTSFLMNDGAISYTVAAAILREAVNDLKGTEALFPRTACTSADVTAQDHISAAYAGLGGGQYACYDESRLQSDYLTCPEGYTPTGSAEWILASASSGDSGDEQSLSSSSSSSSAVSRKVTATSVLVSMFAALTL